MDTRNPEEPRLSEDNDDLRHQTASKPYSEPENQAQNDIPNQPFPATGQQYYPYPGMPYPPYQGAPSMPLPPGYTYGPPSGVYYAPGQIPYTNPPSMPLPGYGPLPSPMGTVPPGYAPPSLPLGPMTPGYAPPSATMGALTPGFAPNNALPTSGNIPSQQVRKKDVKRKIVIGVASLLIGCCVLSVIAAVVSGKTSGQNSQNNGGVASAATDTPLPQPTDPPVPTNTPAPPPTATPVPIGVGQNMALGHDFSQNGSGFTILSPADHFASYDQFAYVITLPSAVGTTQVQLLLVHEEGGGVESVGDSGTVAISNPDFTTLANKYSAGSLMGYNPPGTYKFEMSDGSSIRASATFTFTG